MWVVLPVVDTGRGDRQSVGDGAGVRNCLNGTGTAIRVQCGSRRRTSGNAPVGNLDLSATAGGVAELAGSDLCEHGIISCALSGVALNARGRVGFLKSLRAVSVDGERTLMVEKRLTRTVGERNGGVSCWRGDLN